MTPILPKTVKQPSARAMTGLMEDLSRKRILYAFGLSRNNAGLDNKSIRALRFIVMAGSGLSGQNNCIHDQCVRYVKNSR